MPAHGTEGAEHLARARRRRLRGRQLGVVRSRRRPATATTPRAAQGVRGPRCAAGPRGSGHGSRMSRPASGGPAGRRRRPGPMPSATSASRSSSSVADVAPRRRREGARLVRAPSTRRRRVPPRRSSMSASAAGMAPRGTAAAHPRRSPAAPGRRVPARPAAAGAGRPDGRGGGDGLRQPVDDRLVPAQHVVGLDAHRLPGGVGGDVGVAVAVAADPRPPFQERAHAAAAASRSSPLSGAAAARVSWPSSSARVERAIQARRDHEQGLVEERHHAADLVQRRGRLDAQRRRVPQEADRLAQAAPDLGVLGRRQARVVELRRAAGSSAGAR